MTESANPKSRAPIDKVERLAKANEFIRIIASHGLQHFMHRGSISRLLFDSQGRIVFFDSYTLHYIYTYHNTQWKGFTENYKMKTVILNLRDYIRGKIETGDELVSMLRMSNDSVYTQNPLWGYPEADRVTVVESAIRIFCSNKQP